MPDASEIDLSSYIPVHSFTHYAGLQISAAGSVREVKALTSEASAFITALGVDVSLWDGSKGTYGHLFPSIHEDSKERMLSVERIRALRAQYIDLKRSTYVEASRSQLRKELDAQTKIQGQLDRTVLDLEEKITKLRQKMLVKSEPLREGGGTQQPLFKVLKKLESDLASSRKAAEAMERKIAQTSSDLAETDYAFLRRYAILWFIFKGSTAQILQKCTYNCDLRLMATASSAKTEAESAWRKTVQMKSFYIDAKSGLTRLYKVESTIKAILEHLESALNTLKGIPSSSTSIPLGDVNIDYRLEYTKKLWNTVDLDFRQTMPYLNFSKLQTESRRMRTVTEIFDHGQGTITSLFEGHDDSGKFREGFELLSKFERFEKLHSKSRTNRIAALHKHAAGVYKVINAIYDSQENLVDHAKVEIKRKEEEEIQSSEILLSLWEQVLAISTENM